MAVLDICHLQGLPDLGDSADAVSINGVTDHMNEVHATDVAIECPSSHKFKQQYYIYPSEITHDLAITAVQIAVILNLRANCTWANPIQYVKDG